MINEPPEEIVQTRVRCDHDATIASLQAQLAERVTATGSSSYWEAEYFKEHAAHDLTKARHRDQLQAEQERSERYRVALASIADNRCCDGCMEAGRVASSALDQKKAVD